MLYLLLFVLLLMAVAVGAAESASLLSERGNMGGWWL